LVGVIFDVGAALVAVEDVVGRDRDQVRADLSGRLRDRLDRDGVDRVALGDLDLGAVDRRVGRQVHDHVRTRRLERSVTASRSVTSRS
jgi:hypothetical protein